MNTKLRNELKELINNIRKQKKHNIKQIKTNKKMTKKLKILRRSQNDLQVKLKKLSVDLNNH